MYNRFFVIVKIFARACFTVGYSAILNIDKTIIIYKKNNKL